ncbi:MAG: NADH:ubiquinone reductase (Na(+)-transporting) subunit B [Paludibacteraceae bacterium]|nr:NADH:ubiquinone reductase (Na(+)-transporting) subunit B [Paludibacteraceae bacterium]
MEKFYKFWKKFGENFQEGGKFEKLSSFYDAFDTFLFTPTTTAKKVGAQIHDGSDSKRTMIIVVLALIPCLLFGMFNVGYQHLLATGQLACGMTCALWWKALGFGVLAIIPFYLVSYIVGLGIEFIVAQIKHEEVAEGYLVTGFILPLILPINTPLWQVAIATAFAVIFAKEVFGGTGYNIFNVALIARAFLFFAYPASMTGDSVFVRLGSTWGWDGATAIDGWSGATTLTQLGTGMAAENASFWETFNGLMPGCVGETCVWAILIGAVLLLMTGVASWKVMLSILATAGVTAALFNAFGPDTAIANYPWYMHLISGGLLFGAVFMATDPVTGARTECGKWIYGALIGFMVILVRVLNPGFPEGMMLAILLGNAFAPLIDWCVVRRNVKHRMNR